MESRSTDVTDFHEGALQDEFQGKMMVCPNCRDRVPTTLYCLKCGFPLYNIKHEEEDEEVVEVSTEPFELERKPVYSAELEMPAAEEKEIEEEWDLEEDEDVDLEIDEEPIEIERKMPFIEQPPVEVPLEARQSADDVTSMEPPTLEAPKEEEIREVEAEYKPDPALRELLKDLLNSLSLKLWAVSLLVEERVKEDHFNELYEGYRSRLEKHMKRREELLEKARDIEPLERAMNEARVGLGELEVRRSIGDLKEGEFEAKAPAYRWDIRHYEAEIVKRRAEIDYMEDITKTMPTPEIAKMKRMAQESLRKLNELERSNKVSSGTATRMRPSLEQILKFLGEFE
ncbi:MAG: hypothetical protein ACETVY_04145 [Candidatus Bathyarchaeia archaeon]